MRKPFFSRKLGLWGVLEALGAVAVVGSGAGWLGAWWWAFDLASHFRAQYAAGLLLLAAVLGAARRRKAALVFAAFAAVNGALVLPYCFSGRAATPHAKPTLRVLLINVHTENRRHDLVAACIREADPDVILLEEVNDRWLRNLAGLRTTHPHAVTEPREDNFGIALFSRLPLDPAEVVELGEAEVPSVSATVRVADRRIRILGTHPLLPSGAENSRLRNGQLRAVAQAARERYGPTLVLGDLNVTPWSPHFRALLREGRLADSARGFGWQASWPAYSLPLRIAIDHCLVSAEFTVLRRRLGPHVGSDHLPVFVEVGVK